MTWSRAAIEASIVSRRLHAANKVKRIDAATLNYKPATGAKQELARASEVMVVKQLRAQHSGGQRPVDVIVRSGTRTMGVEVKTMVDNKNNKITMHPESYARKIAWAHSHHASLHTIVIDKRGGTTQQYYRKGIGSFRMVGLTAVKNGPALRALMGL